MFKRNITVIALMIAAAMVLASCSGLSSLEKFNTASDKLTNAKSISMDMDMLLGLNGEDTIGMQEMKVTAVSKYQIPDTGSENIMNEMKMSMLMSMDIMEEAMEIEYYFNEGSMYIGMPSMMDQYMYVSMDDPMFEELDSSTTSMKPNDFLIDIIDEESISVTEETVSYRGKDVEAECLQINITEDNIEQLYSILNTSAESMEVNPETMLEMINIDEFVYKVYLNKDNEIIVFEIKYVMTLEGEAAEDGLSMDIRAEIYDVNETIIEFPDFTDAIDLAEFQ